MSIDCIAAKGARSHPLYEQRSPILDPAVSLVSVGAAGHHDHPVRDARALASNWLSPLLALEVASRGALHFSNDPVKSADFRFWHKADILVALCDVRFWG
jgi:hypothetical protein